MLENLQPMVQFLQNHPHSAGIFTFLVVFCEAMAVIGVIVPGTVTMTAIGILVGMGILSASATFAWAIAGAIVGDCLSYWVGKYYKDRLHKVWPFTKHPQWLNKSEKFFHHHGGKSVFIGRFIGPMRAMTPMVAGMLKMSTLRFLLAAVPSVSLWAIVYLIPGIFLGALSQELPPKIATEFTLGVLGAVILLWLISWLVHHFFRQLYLWFHHLVKVLWQSLKSQRTTRWFAVLLDGSNGIYGSRQLECVISAIFLIIIFFVIAFSVVHHGILTFFNEPVFYLLRSIRGPRLDDLMIAITLLGEYKIILSASVIFIAWLLYRRYWYLAIHYVVLLFLGQVIVMVFKALHLATRPGSFAGVFGTSSFPSGHTVYICIFLGFLAILLSRTLKTHRWWPYVVAGVVSVLVMFSRIYLGAHWLTDVVAGAVISWAIILLVTVSYYRRNDTNIDIKRTVILAIGIFSLVWAFFGVTTWSKQVEHYAIEWRVQTITTADFQSHNNLPWYRLGRLGEPLQVFNLNWLGPLSEIQQALTSRGWEVQPVKFGLREMLNCLFGDSVYRYFPLLPQLYHNRVPALVVTKATFDQEMLSLELWQSDIQIRGVTQPLWLGAVYYNQKLPRMFALHKPKGRVKFIGAVDLLAKDLEGFEWKQLAYQWEQQPQEVREWGWNGKILLIQSKK